MQTIVIKLFENGVSSDGKIVSSNVLRVIKKWGLTLEPMHPNATDAPLTTYFNCAITDGETGEKILDTLRKTVDVEAAYVASMPSLPKN